VHTWDLISVSGDRNLVLTPGPPRVLGRSADCAIPLYDPSVSRDHAELAPGEEGVRVRDLGSTNGVMVNGVRVTDHMAVAGDMVTFGSVSFRLVRVAPPPPPAPTVEAVVPPAATAGGASAPVPAAEPPVRAKVALEGAGEGAAGGDRDQTRGYLMDLLRSSSADDVASKAAALLAVATELARPVSTESLFAKVVQEGFEILAADRAALLTVEGDDLELSLRARRLRSPEADASPMPRALLYDAVVEGAAILAADLGTDERFGESNSALRLAGHSALCVPLVGEGRRVLGLLYLDRSGGEGRTPFLEEDLRFMAVFAGIAGLALQNRRLLAAAQRDVAALARLRQYLSPNIDAEIAAAEQAAATKGPASPERRPVVVLTAEARQLSRLAGELPPAVFGTLLGTFCHRLSSVVFQHGGSLNSLRGGSLVAVWGAPLVAADDADRALRAAQAMASGLLEWNRGRQQAGAPSLDVAIGIEQGTAWVGSLTSGGRQEYTLAGRPLELSMRLAAAASAGEVLLGESLARLLGERPGIEPARRPELADLAAWRLVS
jgi:class 3 adenylate cyclase